MNILLDYSMADSQADFSLCYGSFLATIPIMLCPSWLSRMIVLKILIPFAHGLSEAVFKITVELSAVNKLDPDVHRSWLIYHSS